MTDNTYNVIKPDNGVLIQAWTKSVPLEDAARQQLLNVAQCRFLTGTLRRFGMTSRFAWS